MNQLLDEEGRIAEPTSKNYGEYPSLDKALEEKLIFMFRIWVWFPIVGIIIASDYANRLTDDFGYAPWWL